MFKRIPGILFFVLLLCQTGTLSAAGDPNDAEGSKDPAVFSRMPGFHIYRSEELDFDRFEFDVAPSKTEAVEGRHYKATYYANEDVTLPSALQITRNYINAVKALGGKTVYDFEDGGQQIATLKLEKNDVETWISVRAGSNGMYDLNIIEKQLMKQDVTANADLLAGSIKETGRAAVYGIYFDTGKAEIKPASEPSLKEIAKMIQAGPKMKFYIVGHTDNAGTFNDNLKLSKDRAEAVVKQLVGKYGITVNRLQPFGAGPTAPVTSNQTEEGRAKNRRVELVAQ